MKIQHVVQLSTALLLVAAFALAPAAQSDVNQVVSISLEKSEQGSKYTIQQSGNADYQEFLLNNPRRLVVDIVGARHAVEQHQHAGDGSLVTAVRSSQFSSDPDEVTRVVFDLTEQARYKITREGSNIEVSFFAEGGKVTPPVMEASVATPIPTPEAEPIVKDEDAKETATPAKTEASKETPKTTDKQEDAAKAETSDAAVKAPVKAEQSAETPAASSNVTPTPTPVPAKSVTETSETPKDAEKAEVKTADADTPMPVRARSYDHLDPSSNPNDYMIAAARKPIGEDGQNYVPATPRSYSSELSSYRTGSNLNQLPNNNMTIDAQVADIKSVLRSISEFSGANIIAGPSVEGPVTVHLTNVPWREALDIILKANGYGLRIDNGIFRVQALTVLHDEEIQKAVVRQKKEDLTPLVSKVIELNFTNAKEMQQAMSQATSKRGSISFENGTNAVIINDIPEIAERVAAMVVSLDRKVAQVEITAKMVDVDVEATRELGIKWDFLNIMSNDVDIVGSAKTGLDMASPFGSLTAGTVQSWGTVWGTLETLERDNKADIISNPRITTADNAEALILVGKEIPLIVADEAGNPLTELKKTGIALRVTPHVNSDMSVTLDLHPEVSDLAAQATVAGGIIITLAEAQTRVLVNDGETAAIGGLITEVQSHSVTGLPVIKDVPVLGRLFRYDSVTKKKRELIIFVTPRIVDHGQMQATN